MSKNRIRHNSIDVRKIHVDTNSDNAIDNDRAIALKDKYNDLFYDYEKQKNNIYIRPKRAIKGWHNPDSVVIPINHQSKLRTIKQANRQTIQALRKAKLQQELGL